MELSIAKIESVNFEKILARELKKFAKFHQPSLLVNLDSAINDLGQFCARNIFPISDKWIVVMNAIAIEEVGSDFENHDRPRQYYI